MSAATATIIPTAYCVLQNTNAQTDYVSLIIVLVLLGISIGVVVYWVVRLTILE